MIRRAKRTVEGRKASPMFPSSDGFLAITRINSLFICVKRFLQVGVSGAIKSRA